ncbi:MAG: tetratricopeptide repeat protein, partial [Bacteroidetes bacterium]|nr:tetratricopeptide repeat protein [Bacteroidota bacterium]
MIRFITPVLISAFVLLAIVCDAQNFDGYTKSFEKAMQTGKYDSATYYARESLSSALKEFGEADNNYAVASNNLGIALRQQGEYSDALRYYEKSLAIKEKIYGKTHPNYANVLNSIAGLYQDMGRYADAEKSYNDALSIYKASIGEKHPNYANTLFNLASLYFVMGDYAKAEPLFMTSIDIKKETLGTKHPGYINPLNNVAVLYRRMGNLEKAEKLYNEVISLSIELYGKKSISYIKALNNMTSLYSDQGKYDKAEPLYRETLELQKELLGQGHPDYSVTLNNLAVLYNNRQDYAKAEPLFKEALAIRAATVGEKHPSYASSLCFLANLYLSQDKYQEAEANFSKALDVWKATVGEKHPLYCATLNNLASLYYEQGNLAKADQYFRANTQIRLEEVKNNFSYLSEKEKEKYWQTLRKDFVVFNSFAMKRYVEDPSIAAVMLNIQLATKGLLFNSTVQIRNAILNSGNQTLISRYNTWTGLKEKLGKLYQMDLAELNESGVNIEAIENETNMLEKELSKASDVFANERQSGSVSWKDVQKNLSEGEVAVEFMEIPYYHNKHVTDTTYFVALVVSRESAYPTMVELCLKREIISSMESKISNSGISDYVSNRELNILLYNSLWKKLEPYLEKTISIYLSPSGILNKVSFNCLAG